MGAGEVFGESFNGDQFEFLGRLWWGDKEIFYKWVFFLFLLSDQGVFKEFELGKLIQVRKDADPGHVVKPNKRFRERTESIFNFIH